jgi:molybdenum cofactor biosynthesis protein B
MSEATHAHHRSLAPSTTAIRVAIVTASDSRTPATNDGGRVLRGALEQAGFAVTADELVTEEPDRLRELVATLARSGAADAVVVTGGTGLSPRDRTPEAVGALFERRLPGFGELFRMLSFAEIGAAAMLSRAEAGTIGAVLVFLLPGSPAAVDLAVRKLIAPELAHAVGQLRRHGADHERGGHAR